MNIKSDLSAFRFAFSRASFTEGYEFPCNPYSQAFCLSNSWLSALGISALQFVFNFPKYVSSSATYWLGSMVLSYLLIMMKEFILSGKYKTIPMSALMFEPYERIIIQQFTVIVGSLFLGLGAGKIFVSIFAAIKIWVEVFFDFPRILRITTAKEQLRRSREQ